MAAVSPLPNRKSVPQVAGRSVALDAFRGLTVLLMLLVNNIALDSATPTQLLHAAWGGGLHLADLVFPWFLLATGVSIPFAWASSQRRAQGYGTWFGKATLRSLTLFGLGLLLVSAVAHTPVFALGVLQLIALAFWVGAVLYPIPALLRWGLAGGLLLGYWGAIRFIPVPGVGAGVFEEGQNLLLHLNQNYLSPLGLRGILSVIPTAALVLIASGVGNLLQKPLAPVQKGTRLFFLGLGLSALGYGWSLDLEFNKPYWTPAYILLGAGSGTLLLGVLTWLEQIFGKGLLFLLVVPGCNALLAYIAPILVKVWVLQDWKLGSLNLQNWLLLEAKSAWGPWIGGWVYSLGFVGFWWLVLAWFYYRRWFWRV
ncbi:MAG: DUF5009 domain-containing protein [Meiothermus sp.]|uniref:heparan-alpha-glucosaminide N-acetyltransferase domain-containing protein n=1 Tax=Meiothermus sp. TaxID=1955249 RepID=UPI0025DDF42B|nr:heparan-alpha-glucosaminide N-acetyltransferase domain-containing protein [Meiothermus sp.]MCS7069292.1 DUF5009 domain-containing protein [Meiothermus sp.]MDW8426602.1 DUF5009 domain-containing protein [Meiothermus sp.]